MTCINESHACTCEFWFHAVTFDLPFNKNLHTVSKPIEKHETLVMHQRLWCIWEDKKPYNYDLIKCGLRLQPIERKRVKGNIESFGNFTFLLVACEAFGCIGWFWEIPTYCWPICKYLMWSIITPFDIKLTINVRNTNNNEISLLLPS